MSFVKFMHVISFVYACDFSFYHNAHYYVNLSFIKLCMITSYVFSDGDSKNKIIDNFATL